MEFIFVRIIITILNMKQKRKYSLKFPQIEVFGIAILWILIFSIPLIMKLSNHAADWDTVKYSPSLDNFIAKISWIFLSAQLGGKENLSGRPVHLFWSFIAQ